VCEHVVHLSRDSSTLGDRRRLELALARVFELRARDLCALAIALGAPVDPGHREQQRGKQDRAADREGGRRVVDGDGDHRCRRRGGHQRDTRPQLESRAGYVGH